MVRARDCHARDLDTIHPGNPHTILTNIDMSQEMYLAKTVPQNVYSYKRYIQVHIVIELHFLSASLYFSIRGAY